MVIARTQQRERAQSLLIVPGRPDRCRGGSAGTEGAPQGFRSGESRGKTAQKSDCTAPPGRRPLVVLPLSHRPACLAHRRNVHSLLPTRKSWIRSILDTMIKAQLPPASWR